MAIDKQKETIFPIQIIDVLFPLVGWLIEGFVYPFNNRKIMIDGLPNRPLYFYQKDIIDSNSLWQFLK